MIYETDNRYVSLIQGAATKIYDNKDDLAKDIFDNVDTSEDESLGYVNLRTNFNKQLFALYQPNNPNIPSLARMPSEEDTGLSFTRSNMLEITEPLGEQAKTFEAWLKLPNGYKSRAGIVFGNYGFNRDYFSFEIYPAEYVPCAL